MPRNTSPVRAAESNGVPTHRATHSARLGIYVPPLYRAPTGGYSNNPTGAAPTATAQTPPNSGSYSSRPPRDSSPPSAPPIRTTQRPPMTSRPQHSNNHNLAPSGSSLPQVGGGYGAAVGGSSQPLRQWNDPDDVDWAPVEVQPASRAARPMSGQTAPPAGKSAGWSDGPVRGTSAPTSVSLEGQLLATADLLRSYEGVPLEGRELAAARLLLERLQTLVVDDRHHSARAAAEVANGQHAGGAGNHGQPSSHHVPAPPTEGPSAQPRSRLPAFSNALVATTGAGGASYTTTLSLTTVRAVNAAAETMAALSKQLSDFFWDEGNTMLGVDGSVDTARAGHDGGAFSANAAGGAAFSLCDLSTHVATASLRHLPALVEVGLYVNSATGLASLVSYVPYDDSIRFGRQRRGVPLDDGPYRGGASETSAASGMCRGLVEVAAQSHRPVVNAGTSSEEEPLRDGRHKQLIVVCDPVIVATKCVAVLCFMFDGAAATTDDGGPDAVLSAAQPHITVINAFVALAMRRLGESKARETSARLLHDTLVMIRQLGTYTGARAADAAAGHTASVVPASRAPRGVPGPMPYAVSPRQLPADITLLQFLTTALDVVGAEAALAYRVDQSSQTVTLWEIAPRGATPSPLVGTATRDAMPWRRAGVVGRAVATGKIIHLKRREETLAQVKPLGVNNARTVVAIPVSSQGVVACVVVTVNKRPAPSETSTEDVAGPFTRYDVDSLEALSGIGVELALTRETVDSTTTKTQVLLERLHNAVDSFDQYSAGMQKKADAAFMAKLLTGAVHHLFGVPLPDALANDIAAVATQSSSRGTPLNSTAHLQIVVNDTTNGSNSSNNNHHSLPSGLNSNSRALPDDFAGSMRLTANKGASPLTAFHVAVFANEGGTGGGAASSAASFSMAASSVTNFSFATNVNATGLGSRAGIHDVSGGGLQTWASQADLASSDAAAVRAIAYKCMKSKTGASFVFAGHIAAAAANVALGHTGESPASADLSATDLPSVKRVKSLAVGDPDDAPGTTGGAGTGDNAPTRFTSVTVEPLLERNTVVSVLTIVRRGPTIESVVMNAHELLSVNILCHVASMNHLHNKMLQEAEMMAREARNVAAGGMKKMHRTHSNVQSAEADPEGQLRMEILLRRIASIKAASRDDAGTAAAQSSVFLADLFTPKFDLLKIINFRGEQSDEDNMAKAKELGIRAAVQLFQSTGLPTRFGCPEDTLLRFIIAICARYREPPYHNFFHAVDVLQTVYCFLFVAGAQWLLEPLEQFTLLVAALCHDVDHMGLTNVHHVKTTTPLGILTSAVQGKDAPTSVLEIHHASVTCDILESEEFNVFAGLASEDNAVAYRVLVDTILATDFSRHSATKQELDATVAEFDERQKKQLLAGSANALSPAASTKTATGEVARAEPPSVLDNSLGPDVHSVNIEGTNSGHSSSDEHHLTTGRSPQAATSVPKRVPPGARPSWFDIANTNHRRLACRLLMQAADISNPTKPFAIARHWGQSITEEFFQQGDSERAMGLDVAPMHDRQLSNLAASQIGFINFAVEPLYKSITAKMLPGLAYAYEQLTSNRTEWQAILNNGGAA